MRRSLGGSMMMEVVIAILVGSIPTIRAVRPAILNHASLPRARPLAARSWIDLSSVLN